MHQRLWTYLLLTILSTAAATGPARAADFDGKLTLSGDFRARLEADFDSRRADGRLRDDRDRLRARLRVGLSYQFDDAFQLAVRLRSGSPESHQSPHLTLIDFSGNDTGEHGFEVDRWFVKGSRGGKELWLGRNSLPLWKQNEMFWDDDVTPIGLGFTVPWSNGEHLRFSGGYFSLPVGMRATSGQLAAAQAVYRHGGLTAAGSVLAFDADPDDADAATLLSGNGARDYTVWIASLQQKLEVGRGWVLGADYIHNGESYSASDPDPLTAAFHDRTDGFVAQLSYGGDREPGDWLAGLYLARLETFAVNASYAQDDWVRWGSATETRASGLEGYELRFAYALRPQMNVMARFYSVASLDTVEDGKRFRVDLNVKF